MFFLNKFRKNEVTNGKNSSIFIVRENRINFLNTNILKSNINSLNLEISKKYISDKESSIILCDADIAHAISLGYGVMVSSQEFSTKTLQAAVRDAKTAYKGSLIGCENLSTTINGYKISVEKKNDKYYVCTNNGMIFTRHYWNPKTDINYIGAFDIVLDNKILDYDKCMNFFLRFPSIEVKNFLEASIKKPIRNNGYIVPTNNFNSADSKFMSEDSVETIIKKKLVNFRESLEKHETELRIIYKNDYADKFQTFDVINTKNNIFICENLLTKIITSEGNVVLSSEEYDLLDNEIFTDGLSEITLSNIVKKEADNYILYV